MISEAFSDDFQGHVNAIDALVQAMISRDEDLYLGIQKDLRIIGVSGEEIGNFISAAGSLVTTVGSVKASCEDIHG